MAKRRKAGESKTAKDDNLKEAVVLIPLTDNDGKPFSAETIDAIYDEIFATFRGWTIEGTVKGAYQMRTTGEKRVEELLKVAIFLEVPQIPELEKMVGRWCTRIGQEVILLKIADVVVKFVPPQPETEEP
ncbi:MAG: hypothetical protein ACYC3I_07510 [Gemmataceae bacterium]